MAGIGFGNGFGSLNQNSGFGDSGVMGGGGVPQGMMAYGSGGAPGFGFQQKVNIGVSPVTAQQFGLQQRGQDIGLQQSRIAAEASEFPARLAQERFNQVFPYLQNQFSKFGAGGAGGAGGAASGQPRITTSPVWNPQQIQQQVNQSNAASDASTQSQQRQLANSLGGTGFGANSPLAQALSAGMQNANLASKTGNETNLRLGAAQQNAQQVFGEQQAAEKQYASRQQEQLEAQRTLAGQSNALLAALASLSR